MDEHACNKQFSRTNSALSSIVQNYYDFLGSNNNNEDAHEKQIEDATFDKCEFANTNKIDATSKVIVRQNKDNNFLSLHHECSDNFGIEIIN